MAEAFEDVPATAATRLALMARGPGTLVARGGKARLLKTESGKVVTHGEVLGGLLKRAEIEAEVVDGERPEWISCKTCKAPVKVTRASGTLPNRCGICTGAVCFVCKSKKTKRGQRSMCRKCAVDAGKYREASRKACAAETHEQRSERARKRNAAKTPEERSECARKAARELIARMTPEQLAERGHTMRHALLASTTPEQRSEIARKRNAARTPEQRSASAGKGKAAMTAEQRSAAMRKGHATRRAKQAANAASNNEATS